MKNLVFCIPVLLLFSCSTKPKRLTTVEAKSEIINFQSAFNDARTKKNMQQLDNLLSDNFKFVDPQGHTVDKKTMLNNDFAQGQPTFDEFKYNIDNTFADGDMIVTSGMIKTHGKLHDFVINGSYRFTDMFVKNGDKWQLTLSQLTEIKNDKE